MWETCKRFSKVALTSKVAGNHQQTHREHPVTRFVKERRVDSSPAVSHKIILCVKSSNRIRNTNVTFILKPWHYLRLIDYV